MQSRVQLLKRRFLITEGLWHKIGIYVVNPQPPRVLKPQSHTEERRENQEELTVVG
jgi:hypothetical protein